MTGATGQLGSKIVDQLVLQGLHVTALTRSLAKLDALWGDEDARREKGIEGVEGDLLDVPALLDKLQALKRPIAVMILAAGGYSYLGISNTKNSPHKVDYKSTCALLKAAADSDGLGSSLQKVVLISSMGASGGFSSFLLDISLGK